MKIVTGAEASQFKSMRFRNYCKFSCTSGSVCPRAKGGRARLRGPGDEDETGFEPGSQDSDETGFEPGAEDSLLIIYFIRY